MTVASPGNSLRFFTSLEVCRRMRDDFVGGGFFTCLSQRRFLRTDSVSSLKSMLRRVVRGESANEWLFEVDIMIGRDFDACSCDRKASGISSSCTGEVPSGPFGDEVRERRIAGVDLDAAFCRAAARSFSCIMLVSNERRDVRCCRESTRWNISFSSIGGASLASSSSSHSSSTSSSSSIALSDCSSSSESSNTSSSYVLS